MGADGAWVRWMAVDPRRAMSLCRGGREEGYKSGTTYGPALLYYVGRVQVGDAEWLGRSG